MADVISLARLREQKMSGVGEMSFLCCTCQSDTGYAPVVQHDAKGWFVAALVCINCDKTTHLLNGREIFDE